MKKNEKNIMWAAIAVLAVLQLWPVVAPGKEAKGGPDARRQWMSQVREHLGSRGDIGRGERTSPRVRGVRSRDSRGSE
jgi:hypothetical protein